MLSSDGFLWGKILPNSGDEIIYFSTAKRVENTITILLYKMNKDGGRIDLVERLMYRIALGVTEFVFYPDGNLVSINNGSIRVINENRQTISSYSLLYQEIVSDNKNGGNFAYIDISNNVFVIFIDFCV